MSAPLDLSEWGRPIQKGGCVLSIKCQHTGLKIFIPAKCNLLKSVCFVQYDNPIYYKCWIFFFFNVAHLIPTTVYLDKIFDLNLFYNELKSVIFSTIKLYFILNLHLVSYTTSTQYKYTWPNNIILLFYAFPFQMTYLIYLAPVYTTIQTTLCNT